MDKSEAQSESGRRTKVVRLIDEYELGDIGDRLEHRWTTDGDDRMSLRDLADYFNQQLLAAAMAEAGMQPLSEKSRTCIGCSRPTMSGVRTERASDGDSNGRGSISNSSIGTSSRIRPSGPISRSTVGRNIRLTTGHGPT
jgi:hypothetical protein